MDLLFVDTFHHQDLSHWAWHPGLAKLERRRRGGRGPESLHDGLEAGQVGYHAGIARYLQETNIRLQRSLVDDRVK